MKKSIKKYLILSLLFFSPIFIYIFLVSGINNFARLPILTTNVLDIQSINGNIQGISFTNTTITHECYFDEKWKRVIDKKTGKDKEAPNPEWALFQKCVRGDTSDNVFSAYPGVRLKGTRNKVGLEEAFNDKKTKGYSWNNLMLQRWLDHEGKEHRVLDCLLYTSDSADE